MGVAGNCRWVYSVRKMILAGQVLQHRRNWMMKKIVDLRSWPMIQPNKQRLQEEVEEASNCRKVSAGHCHCFHKPILLAGRMTRNYSGRL